VPVCGNAKPEDITPHTFDGKSFRCPICGDYDISGSIWDSGTFQRPEPERRLAALIKAKRFSGPTNRPMIMTFSI
jgi:hypothetical protein